MVRPAVAMMVLAMGLWVGCDGAQPAAQDPDAGWPGPDGGTNPLIPRVENTTCQLPPAPPIGGMELTEAFPEVAVERPVWLGVAPGGRDLYLIAQGGRVVVFDPKNPSDFNTFLDISVSRAGNEEGLLGLAFHPQYATNGRFYIYYSAAGPRRSVVSEVQRSARDPRVADRGTERILMEIPEPYSNHNGGDLRFGPDGFLYISLGDGGSAGDPQNNGQHPENVLGAILRVDVDHPDPICHTPYGIPADNPFAEGRCGFDQPLRGRPEIYAWGLRNVWRMAFDAATGELWAADVGQDRWEEVNVIERGGNYGWRAMEGEHCFQGTCDPASFKPPVHVYGHDVGKSITGGFVYRGAALPELFGAYLFADYDSGKIWALRRRAGAAPEVTLLADTPHEITSFGADADGEVYLLTFTRGLGIARLQRVAGDAHPTPLPATLSATGCFADVAAGVPAPGVIAYQPQATFWSDGAEKTRYFALPAGTSMTWSAEDAFEFPVGSVLVKAFRQPGAEHPFETRLMVREADHWSGYSYRWRADGTDADLLAGRVETEVAGPDGSMPWLYPDRGQCEACHTRASGGALGLSSRQLNGVLDYGDGPRNQLETLVGAGYLRGLPRPPNTLPALTDPTDESASLEARARAWLQTNCAQCHRDGGRADTDIDLRIELDLAGMKICNVVPRHPDPDAPEAPLVAPGDPEGSVLYRRISTRGERQMPPLATSRVDEAGRALLAAWITQLRCP